MHTLRTSFLSYPVVLASAVLMAGVGHANAQAPAAPRGAATARLTSASTPTYRKLAPGVETKVDPKAELEETYSRHDVTEMLTVNPSYAERPWSQGKSPAKDTRFAIDAWHLDFSFKPVRFVTVDVPDKTGRMQRKLVWYMVYRVTNRSDKTVSFVPQFLLESRDTNKKYPDRLIPVAVPVIQMREDPNRKLLNSTEMEGPIPPSPKGSDLSVWGVVTWEDVDPRTDRFSIYIKGLSSAYQWKDPAGAYKAGDPAGTGRQIVVKTLKLNFWRPSDDIDEKEKEIRFGIPGEVDYEWIYR